MWQSIDDLDGADFVTSASSVSAVDFTVALGSLTDPAVSSGHVLRALIRKSSGTGAQDVRIELLSDGTVVASRDILGVTSTFTLHEFTLTSTEADAITSYSDLTVRITKLAGAKTSAAVGGVQLEIPGVVDPPVVTSFTPDVGAIGDTIAITGSNFTDASDVTFGATSATFTVASDTQITATVPSLTEGSAYTISVTTPSGSDTSDMSFEVAYLSPADDDTDQTDDLQGWLDSVPDGEFAAFRTGVEYTSEGRLDIVARNDLAVLGRDATIERTALLGDVDPTAKTEWVPQILIQISNGVSVSDLSIVSVGSGSYNSTYEGEAAIRINGSIDVVLTDINIDHPAGDAYEIAWYQAPGCQCVGDPTEHVTITGGNVDGPGRMGMSITSSATDVELSGVAFGSIGRSVFDIEQTSTAAVVDGVLLTENTVEAFALNFFGAGGLGEQRNVTISLNVVPTLKAKVGSPNGVVDRFDFVFTENVGTEDWTPGMGAVVQGREVDGFTVTDNQQAGTFSTGGGAVCVSCIDFVNTGNSWPDTP